MHGYRLNSVSTLFLIISIGMLGNLLGMNATEVASANDTDNSEQERQLTGSVNIALGRPAYQSSTHNPGQPASNAVDGNINSNTHTNNGPGELNWLVVDLQQEYFIRRVVVTNRPPCCPERMDYFLVGVTNNSPLVKTPTRGSYSMCGQYPRKAGVSERMTVYCNEDTPSGRYVVIQQPTDLLGWMAFAEVEVYSYDKQVINLRSYGAEDQPGNGRYGFVKVNNVTKFGSSYGGNQDPNYRGINTFVLNVNDNSISGWRRFDTWADVDQAHDFVEYFHQLRDGAIIIGVTADGPLRALGPALRVLKAAGVDVYDVGVGGKFAFVLQKGYPEKTLMVKQKAGGNALELNISITGSSEKNIIFKKI